MTDSHHDNDDDDNNNRLARQPSFPSCRTHGKELHIAPMLDVSYPEFRYLMRLLTQRAILWTEMIMDETLLFGTDAPLRQLQEESTETDTSLSSFQTTVVKKDTVVENDKDQSTDTTTNATTTTTSSSPPRPPLLVCQLGGNNPEWISRAVAMIVRQQQQQVSLSIAEINLNAGCPSNRVASQKAYGAALMKDPQLTGRILQSMQSAIDNHTSTSIHVSIKTRIGVDDNRGYDFLQKYLSACRDHGCRRFYLHARPVWTHGLSPAQNRFIPPLDYSVVYRICRAFPDCLFWLNGGIRTLEQAKVLLGIHKDAIVDTDDSSSTTNNGLDGTVSCATTQESCRGDTTTTTTTTAIPNVPSNLVGCMMGRAAMDNPAMFGNADDCFFGASTNPSRNRRHVLEQYAAYLQRKYPGQYYCNDNDDDDGAVKDKPKSGCQRHNENGMDDGTSTTQEKEEQEQNQNVKMIPTRVIDRALKPILGMFFGMPGTKKWRRILDGLSRDKSIRKYGPGYMVLRAMEVMPDELLDQEFC